MDKTRDRLIASIITEESLNLLSVDLTKTPSLSTFPARFNSQAFPVWKDIINDARFMGKMSAEKNNLAKWIFITKRYMRDCFEDGIDPIIRSSTQAVNDYAVGYLKRARLEMIRFLNISDVFSKVTIQRVVRSYKVHNGHLEISGTAEIRPGSWDSTFESWIAETPYPGFRRVVESSGREYVRELPGSVELKVKFVGSRLTLSYSLICGNIPRPDLGKRIPTVPQIQEFLESTIWIPLIQSYRLPSVGQRLI